MSKNQSKNWLRVSILSAVTAGLLGGITGCQIESEETPQITDGSLDQAYILRDFRSKRASSWNRTGKNQDNVTVPAGGAEILLEEQGAGCIKHFYWTYIEFREERREKIFRGLVLRAFWDGSEKPSIEVPFGDFFGVSNGHLRPVRSLAFTTNPGGNAESSSWGFNCYLPMPFTQGARIELLNQTDQDLRVWFHIDYELYDDGSSIHPRAGRLHAIWNRENPTKGVPFEKTDNPKDRLNMKNRAQLVNLTGEENYDILNIKGNGQFVGYFMTVVNFAADPWTWWGEGDDMIFIDGEDFPPSFHGTGSEEIFGGGACPAVEYSGPYTGFHCVENWNYKPGQEDGGKRWLGTNGLYRFHVTDPIRFDDSIRVSIEHGHGNNKSNDHSSVAFWYEDGINQKLPPLIPFEERGFTTNYEAPPGDEQ